ncbi:MAG: aspartyl protease family protein [Planctomycetota bacterium]
MPVHRVGRSVQVDMRVGEATVRALFDTGAPFVLRLDRNALQRRGLPAAVAAWTGAGALPLPMGAAGGKNTMTWITTLPSWGLGDGARVRYVDAAVQFADVEVSVGTHSAIVGAGALRAFARVGLGIERNLLEL